MTNMHYPFIVLFMCFWGTGYAQTAKDDLSPVSHLLYPPLRVLDTIKSYWCNYTIEWQPTGSLDTIRYDCTVSEKFIGNGHSYYKAANDLQQLCMFKDSMGCCA